jgi:hypothetical protein
MRCPHDTLFLLPTPTGGSSFGTTRPLGARASLSAFIGQSVCGSVDWASDAELTCLASSPPEGAQAPLHLLHVAVANQKSVASPDVRVYGVGGGARYEALVDEGHSLISVPGVFEAKLTSTIEVNCDAVVIGGISAPDGASGYGVCSEKLGDQRIQVDQVMSRV